MLSAVTAPSKISGGRFGIMTDTDIWHWSIRIQEYLDADWSKKPSPFAVFTSQYLKPSSKILELGAGAGAGAGQDSLWFAANGHEVICSDYNDFGFKEIESRAKANNIDPDKLHITLIDTTKKLPFNDGELDCVYAQLSLHYFDDNTTAQVFAEIGRVLKKGGVLAVMMNSTKDPEYDTAKLDSDGFMHIKGLSKRYYSVETMKNLVSNYEVIVLDDLGRTAKDDAKNTFGMIRFVGKK